jgi:hypothetical protein
MSIGHIQNEFQKSRPQLNNRSAFTQQNTQQSRPTIPTVFEQQSNIGNNINMNNPYSNNIQSVSTKLNQTVSNAFDNINKQREMIEQKPAHINFQDSSLEKNNNDIQRNYEEMLKNRGNINIPPPPSSSTTSISMTMPEQMNSDINMDQLKGDAEYLSFFSNTSITEPSNIYSMSNGDNMNFQDLVKSSGNITSELEQSFKQTNVSNTNNNINTTNNNINNHNNNINNHNSNINNHNNNVNKSKTKILYFNTKFRPNYVGTKSTDYIQPIYYPLKNIISSRLVSIELPQSIYLFSGIEGTNIFGYTMDNINYVVKIPDGTYNKEEFIRMINENDIVNSRLEFSIDTYSGKMKIKSKDESNFTINFGLGNSEYERNLGWIIGYRNKTYESGNEYISEGVYMNKVGRYYYFTMNDYNINKNEGVIVLMSNGYLDQNLFGRITEDGLLKGEIMKREYHEPVLINKIGVKLINEYGEVVNMNNMDYTFGIEFEMVE